MNVLNKKLWLRHFILSCESVQSLVRSRIQMQGEVYTWGDVKAGSYSLGALAFNSESCHSSLSINGHHKVEGTPL